MSDTILKWHIYLQLSTLPLPQLWSALFFFMLYTLGLDSSMCMIESVSTFVVDSAPTTLRSRKTLVTLAICIVFFLASIVFACDAATHLVDIIDYYCGGPSLIWGVFLEAGMVAFFYGVQTFVNDLVEITRSKALGRAWPLFYFVYYFVTPASLALVRLSYWVIFNLYHFTMFSRS